MYQEKKEKDDNHWGLHKCINTRTLGIHEQNKEREITAARDSIGSIRTKKISETKKNGNRAQRQVIYENDEYWILETIYLYPK